MLSGPVPPFYKTVTKQLRVRRVEWLILNFASCVTHRARLFYGLLVI